MHRPGWLEAALDKTGRWLTYTKRRRGSSTFRRGPPRCPTLAGETPSARRPRVLPAIDGEDAELTPATTRDAARLEIVGSADGRWFEAATAAETPSAPADVPDDAKAPFALAFGRLVCVLTALGSLGAMILIVT